MHFTALPALGARCYYYPVFTDEDPRLGMLGNVSHISQ